MMADEKKEAIILKLLESPDNMRSACEIHKVFDEAKGRLLLKLFKAIEEKVKEPPLKSDKAAGYYYENASYTWKSETSSRKNPSLIYPCKGKTNVWIRFACDFYCDAFYVGYFYPDLHDWGKDEDWEPCDFEFENRGESLPIGFSGNRNLFLLCGGDNFDKFVDECVQKIKKWLDT